MMFAAPPLRNATSEPPVSFSSSSGTYSVTSTVHIVHKWHSTEVWMSQCDVSTVCHQHTLKLSPTLVTCSFRCYGVTSPQFVTITPSNCHLHLLLTVLNVMAWRLHSLSLAQLQTVTCTCFSQLPISVWRLHSLSLAHLETVTYTCYPQFSISRCDVSTVCHQHTFKLSPTLVTHSSPCHGVTSPQVVTSTPSTCHLHLLLAESVLNVTHRIYNSSKFSRQNEFCAVVHILCYLQTMEQNKCFFHAEKQQNHLEFTSD